ncbi:MAG: hypothetical protein AAGI48_12295 [Verrucomicrobiota bacterium]
MEATHPTFPPELAFIIGESHLAKVALSWLPAEDVPEPYQGLLNHDHDMTSELAAFHGEPISLEVLKSEQNDHCHLREVVLHGAETDKPVEYGVIEILLDAFPAELRPDILAGHIPLGSLIINSKLLFHSEPQGFFSVPSDHIPDIFPKSTPSEILYGRYNHLIRDDGSCLARIIEILPSTRAR